MIPSLESPLPVLVATHEALSEEAPVWIPLRTPFAAICKVAFHPAGFQPEGRGHSKLAPAQDGTLANIVSAMKNAGVDPRRLARSDDAGFRIARWLKDRGELVAKNEPIALVDAARTRSIALFAGLDLRDPVIYAPESGELVWQERSDQPHRIFGLIRSTNGLIDANLDHPIRSNLVPFIDAATQRLLQRSVVWRGKLRLLDRADLDYLTELGAFGGRRALELTRRNLFPWCHGLSWPTPPANYRASGWGKATAHERRQLLKVHTGPASAQYDQAWARTIESLRWEGFDIERMGLGFALPPVVPDSIHASAQEGNQ